MRSLLILSGLVIVALAIDAYSYGGRYSRVVVREANYQTQQFAYKVSRYFEPRI